MESYNMWTNIHNICLFYLQIMEIKFLFIIKAILQFR